MEKTQPIIEFGKCPFCEMEVMSLDRNNNPQKLDNYSEFWILLSDSSRMKVAICKDCRKTLTQQQVDELMIVHREFWLKGIDDSIDRMIAELQNRRQEQTNYYENLNCAKYGLTERDLE